MAGLITNYGTLKDAIAQELDRYDLEAYIPRFVQMGESRIYREVRAEKMLKAFGASDVTNTIDGTLDVPSDFLQLNFMYLNTNPSQVLEQISMQQMIDAYPNRSGQVGRPTTVAIDSLLTATGQDFGRRFLFGPKPDSNYTVLGTFFRQFTLLTAGADDATPNELFTDHPDLWFTASVVSARAYVDARDQRMQEILDRHETTYRETKEWLNDYQRREQRATSMRTRVR